jgi:hypothetical protein
MLNEGIKNCYIMRKSTSGKSARVEERQNEEETLRSTLDRVDPGVGSETNDIYNKGELKVVTEELLNSRIESTLAEIEKINEETKKTCHDEIEDAKKEFSKKLGEAKKDAEVASRELLIKNAEVISILTAVIALTVSSFQIFQNERHTAIGAIGFVLAIAGCLSVFVWFLLVAINLSKSSRITKNKKKDETIGKWSFVLLFIVSFILIVLGAVLVDKGSENAVNKEDEKIIINNNGNSSASSSAANSMAGEEKM